MQIKIRKNTNEIANELAILLMSLVAEKSEKRIHIALSGGNTPKAIFKYLTEKYGTKLASSRYHFWWGDDRCVPPNHDDSNYKWAWELWLQPIGVHPENIHRIVGENNPQQEAIRYENEMKDWISLRNGIPRFDLIILGLGDDGHTASVFPQNMKLLLSENWCEVATHPTSGQLRITVTGKVLNNAQRVVFISTGAGKAEIIRKVVKDAILKYPASHIKPIDGEIIWMVDEEAGKMLG
jgi:6-phosphogluconolactonase